MCIAKGFWQSIQLYADSSQFPSGSRSTLFLSLFLASIRTMEWIPIRLLKQILILRLVWLCGYNWITNHAYLSRLCSHSNKFLLFLVRKYLKRAIFCPSKVCTIPVWQFSRNYIEIFHSCMLCSARDLGERSDLKTFRPMQRNRKLLYTKVRSYSYFLFMPQWAAERVQSGIPIHISHI